MQESPIICQTFKGILPSELADRYCGPHGRDALEFDLEVCMEIQSQREDALGKTDVGKRAKGAVARRNQRRAKREVSGAEMFKHLQQSGFIKED